MRESFNLVSKRPDTVCNFLEGTEVTHSGTKAWTGICRRGKGDGDGRDGHGTTGIGARCSLQFICCCLPALLLFCPTCFQYWGPDVRLIYRHYATLYFIFAVDEAESELGILDLIQVFVEALDKCFENVCELDLIFHIDKSERERTRTQTHNSARWHALAQECSRRHLIRQQERVLAWRHFADSADCSFSLQPLRSVVPAGFTSSSTRL